MLPKAFGEKDDLLDTQRGASSLFWGPSIARSAKFKETSPSSEFVSDEKTFGNKGVTNAVLRHELEAHRDSKKSQNSRFHRWPRVCRYSLEFLVIQEALQGIQRIIIRDIRAHFQHISKVILIPFPSRPFAFPVIS